MKNSKKEIIAESNHWFPGRKTGSAKMLSAKEGHELLENAGLILTSLRLPGGTVEVLKKMAENEGLKYQTYIRKILVQHAQKKDSVERRLAKVEQDIEQLKKTG